jgi:asparagine synthase (glutamine-hydrolysing)
MVSDVPLGTFLSGGIDSPLVSARAALAVERPLSAFTIGNGEHEMDESVEARAYAQRLGFRHFVEHYTPDKAIQWLDRVVDACGEPMADVSIFPTMLVSCLARREVTVALSGDGGDELFWGYADRFGSVLERSEEFRRPRWLRAGRRAATRLSRSGDDYSSLSHPTIGDWYRGVHSRLSDSMLNVLFNDFPGWPGEFDLFRYSGWQENETAQWLRWNELNGHLSRVLLKVDRASMFHSLEVRVPLLDREVIDVAARVDWRSCLNPGDKIGKLPLRRALAKHVEFQSEAKKGFSVPMDEWLRGPLLPVFHDSVLTRMEILGLPVNRVALTGLLNDHVDGRVDYSRWLWTLLFLSLWSEKYLER